MVSFVDTRGHRSESLGAACILCFVVRLDTSRIVVKMDEKGKPVEGPRVASIEITH